MGSLSAMLDDARRGQSLLNCRRNQALMRMDVAGRRSEMNRDSLFVTS